jgi:ATP-dependent DNA helicase RecQ
MYSIEEGIQHGLDKLGYQSLRDGQQEVIESYLKGKYVFFCSPTGSGKSLCYEIAPYIFDFVLFGKNSVRDKDRMDSVCIVVSPLISLMQDQVASLRKRGIEAIHIGADTTSQEGDDVKSGKYNLIFASPEALLNKHRYIFRGKLKDSLRAVFVDECHCIAKWLVFTDFWF